MRDGIRALAAIGVSATMVATGAAIAGPDWEEGSLGSGDAGRLPGDAQVPHGRPPGSALDEISGAFDNPLVGPGDLQDMFLVEIAVPGRFSAIANPPPVSESGPGNVPNVQLWLFDANGFGLLGSDGAGDGADFCSRAQGTCNASDDGTGIVITKPGRYFLAISLFDSDPISVTGAPIFAQATPDEVSGPDGLGGDEPISDWTNATGSGLWTISLQGVVYGQCRGDANRDGLINIDDIVSVILVFGSTNNPDQDLDGDGAVDIDDVVEVVLNYGSCTPVPLPM